MRCAIYARYSSDNQSNASIEDQVRQCKSRIEREGWTLIQVYSDAAIPPAGLGAVGTPRNGRGVGTSVRDG